MAPSQQRYCDGVAMHEPGEDDVVEQGGAPLRLPEWARWLPALGGRPPRGAAILGIAGLVAGLAAGYALGYRHPGKPARPSQATVASAVPPATSGFTAQVYPPPAPGGPGYATSPGTVDQSGLAQTGGTCSVQHGSELQVGVEVINLSETAITLGQVKPILPPSGLRLASQQWAPCGALSPSWQAPDGGMIVIIKSSTGVVEVGSSAPGSAAVLPPNSTAWLSATLRVLVACPSQLPVQFSANYQENGRTHTAQLEGFPELGRVTYTGCKESS
jgi:hypothetical protein